MSYMNVFDWPEPDSEDEDQRGAVSRKTARAWPVCMLVAGGPVSPFAGKHLRLLFFPKGLKSLLTLCRAALAALVGAAAQRAQVAVLQRAVAVVAARATGRDQLEQVLLRHEAARKRPAT